MIRSFFASPALLLILLLASPSATVAQNEERKWAIELSLGPTFIKDKTTLSGQSGTESGLAKYLGFEYFLFQQTHFSVRAGLQAETLYLGSQLITAVSYAREVDCTAAPWSRYECPPLRG